MVRVAAGGSAHAPRGAAPATDASAVARAIRVRAAAPHDAAAIAAIWNHEALATLATTDTEPRSVAAQRRWLAAHSVTYPVIVATDAVSDAGVAGFAALTAYRPKPAFRNTVEDSVYVDPAWRSSGVGRLLLRELLRLAATNGHHSVVARITTGNVASRRLHESFGFRLVGVEQEVAFKLGRWLDVAVYQRLL
jgi:phosphinothricin acetyltransferase